MSRREIIERVARVWRGDYETMHPYDREELSRDAEDVLDAAGFFELVEVVEEYREKCNCVECMLKECENCEKICATSEKCSYDKMCGTDNCPLGKLDAALAKIRGEGEVVLP